jgi:outer membrane protein assembly factor BamB
VVGYAKGATGILVSKDLESGETNWSVEAALAGAIASDGERIYGFSFDDQFGESSMRLTAVDLVSGESVWTGPTLYARSMSRGAVVYDRGVVYGADFMGNMIAVDATSGEVIWQHPEKPREPTASEISADYAGTFGNAQIVLTGDYAHSITLGQTLVSVDRASGLESARQNLRDAVKADIEFTLLQADQRTLIATVVQSERKASENDVRGPSPTTLVELDPTTLAILSTTPFPDGRGTPVLTAETIYVPAAFEEDGTGHIYPIDRTSGAIGEPIRDVTAKWDIVLSASGTTLIAITFGTITYIDMHTGEVKHTISVEAAPSETLAYSPAMMWDDRFVILSQMGEIIMIDPDPAATPTP